METASKKPTIKLQPGQTMEQYLKELSETSEEEVPQLGVKRQSEERSSSPTRRRRRATDRRSKELLAEQREADQRRREAARSSLSSKGKQKQREGAGSYAKQEAIQQKLRSQTALGEERPTKEYLRKSIAVNFNKQPKMLEKQSQETSSSQQLKEALELLEREKRLQIDAEALEEMERMENESREEMDQEYNVRLDIQSYQLQDGEQEGGELDEVQDGENFKELGRFARREQNNPAKFKGKEHVLAKSKEAQERPHSKFKPEPRDFPLSHKKVNYFSLVKAGLSHQRNELERVYGQCYLGRVMLCMFDKMLLSSFSVLNMAKNRFLERSKESLNFPPVHLYSSSSNQELKAKLLVARELRKELQEVKENLKLLVRVLKNPGLPIFNSNESFGQLKSDMLHCLQQVSACLLKLGSQFQASEREVLEGELAAVQQKGKQILAKILYDSQAHLANMKQELHQQNENLELAKSAPLVHLEDEDTEIDHFQLMSQQQDERLQMLDDLLERAGSSQAAFPEPLSEKGGSFVELKVASFLQEQRKLDEQLQTSDEAAMLRAITR